MSTVVVEIHSIEDENVNDDILYKFIVTSTEENPKILADVIMNKIESSELQVDDRESWPLSWK